MRLRFDVPSTPVQALGQRAATFAFARNRRLVRPAQEIR